MNPQLRYKNVTLEDVASMVLNSKEFRNYCEKLWSSTSLSEKTFMQTVGKLADLIDNNSIDGVM